MKIEIMQRVIKDSQPAYLVAIDGGAPEFISLEALKPHFDNPEDEIIVNFPDGNERTGGT